MTSVANPAEYALEQQRLEQTLAAIASHNEARGANLRASSEDAVGADDCASQALRSHYRTWMREHETLVEQIRTEAYFGRIDFCVSGMDAPESLYIGQCSFAAGEVQIIDWRAPVAALFYRPPARQMKYQCPSGTVSVTLHLKRRLHIRAHVLERIVDEFNVRPGQDSVTDTGWLHKKSIIQRPRETQPVQTSGTDAGWMLQDAETFLKHILSQKASTRLRQIIASIQAEQYALIEAKPEQLLIVQGVAGSGKTSVAVHRLAYLLYPGNATGIEPQRCIIFGPNRLFLNYVIAILPRLGVEQVLHTMPVAWALEQLQLKPKQITDVAFDAILSPTVSRQEKIRLYRRSQFKTSHRMAQLLLRYIEHLRESIQFPEQGWTVQIDGIWSLALHLTHEQLVTCFQGHAQRPLREHRARFLDTLARLAMRLYEQAVTQKCETLTQATEDQMAQTAVWEEQAAALKALAAETRSAEGANGEETAIAQALEQGAWGLERLAEQHRHKATEQKERIAAQGRRAVSEITKEAVANKLREQLERHLDACWPPFDLIKNYTALVGDADLLTRLGVEIADPDLLPLTVGQVTGKGNMLDVTDIPALHYLSLLVSPRPQPRYDHIVIDEAQDVSELEILTLKQFFSRNQSFTILGDLAQSLYSHRGLANWQQVKAQCAGHEAECAYHALTVSYRTTHEITMVANTILQSMKERAPVSSATLDLPLATPFERTGQSPRLQCVSNDAALIMEIKAVLQRNRADGYSNIAIIAKTEMRCKDLGDALKDPAITLAVSADFDYQGGIILLPVYLAKGLEFDSVMVVDADDRTYTDTEFDARLLYVAVTRPLHELALFWIGNPSLHIREVTQR